MLKIFSLITAGFMAFLGLVGQTFTLSGSDVTSLGTAANDIATSSVGVIASLVGPFAPLIVVGLALAFILGMLRMRG